MEMTWQCSQMMDASAALASLGLTSSDSDAFADREFKFALRVHGIGNSPGLKPIILAAERPEELEIWTEFPKQLQVREAQCSALLSTLMNCISFLVDGAACGC